MTRILKAAILTLLLLAAFTAGSILNAPPTGARTPGRTVLYWHDPMHPAYHSDSPGVAPDCGMQLEPVYADDTPAEPSSRADAAPGTVRITTEQQQLIGVRSQPAEWSAGTHDVRTPGRVTADERRVYRLDAFTNGWIRKTYSNSVGSLVRRGEPLASFYAREFLSAQQSYFYALDALDRRSATGEAQLTATRAQVQAAVDSLQALGMSEIQVAELARTRQPTQEIDIRAPASGFILVRNVSPGQRVEGGQELFVIADLSRVWVLADLFQHEADFVHAGQKVTIALPQQRREFIGTVSDVLPQFDPATRTLKVRIEVDNPRFALRPDMFVDVRFPLNLPRAVTVPADAVLDSGLRQTVFVDLGDGYFEPRHVETGWRFGDRVQILGGVMPGERVVTSGNFLIDSESRLKAAAAGIRGEPARDPVCGMDVDQSRARGAGLTLVKDGQTHFFCSSDCKAQFAAPPGSGK